jgi:hypothetical protein
VTVRSHAARWALVVWFASNALAGVAFAAKAGKKGKAAKTEKQDKVEKAEKPEKADKKRDPSLAYFGMIRPENAGMMNLVPARISFDPGSSIVSSRVTHLHPNPKKDLRGLVLVGGDSASLALKPGTYSVQILTPVADQPVGGYPHGPPRVWESPIIKVVLSQGEAICLLLEPGIDGSEYDGSWTLGKTESPADCGPMTQRVSPEDELAPAAQ